MSLPVFPTIDAFHPAADVIAGQTVKIEVMKRTAVSDEKLV